MWQERGTSSYNFQIKKRGNRDVKEVAVISGRNPEDTIKSLLAEEFSEQVRDAHCVLFLRAKPI